MDVEIVAGEVNVLREAVLKIDQRLDQIEGALTSAAENNSNYLTQESIPAILDTIRSEQAVLLEQARTQAALADAEARVAEAEAEEAAAEETVAILEAEQEAVGEPLEPEVEIIEEEPSPEPEGSSTPSPTKKKDMEQLGFR